MSFNVFLHASLHPNSFARFMPKLSLESIKMEKFDAETLYPNLNARVYQVARKPAAQKSVELPILGYPAEKLGIKKGDYSDVFYRVGFTVNREVSLVGLEFFGPSEVNFTRYHAEVAVSRIEEDWGWWSWLWYWSDKPMYRIVDLQSYHAVNVEARKGEHFFVRFPRPVTVLPNLWTDIKFKLDGPVTEFKEFEATKRKVFLDGGGSVKFDFLRGSKQLSGMHFVM